MNEIHTTKPNGFEGDVAPTLESIFGSRAEVRILGHLIDSDPDQAPYRQYDIADAIEMSEATVSRTIRKFVDLGIVEREPDGVVLSDETTVRCLMHIAATVDVSEELFAETRFDAPDPMDGDDPNWSYTPVGSVHGSAGE